MQTNTSYDVLETEQTNTNFKLIPNCIYIFIGPACTIALNKDKYGVLLHLSIIPENGYKLQFNYNQ